MPRILILMRDPRLGKILVRALATASNEVVHASDPVAAGDAMRAGHFDLIVLDASVAESEGFGPLRDLCGDAGAGRVMLVATRGESHETLSSLGFSADAHVAAPLRLDALVDRARSLLDVPSDLPRTNTLRAGGIELDPWTRRARVGDTHVFLTGREFSLLEVFLRHPGQVLSRAELEVLAWENAEGPGSNAVEVYVGYLRRKLGAETIETVRGRGYRLRA